MSDKELFFFIVTARNGSKRLSKKNILPLAGKPLIAWTIETALNSKYINEVIVSTDDNEIAEISKKSGAKVPFIRPAHLATDTANSFDVVKHALDFYKKELHTEFEFLILLQPTSPLRTSSDIDNSIEILKTKKADAVVSVCKTEHSLLECNTLPADLSLNNFLTDKIKNKRLQDLPVYYRINGAIYICSVHRFLDEKTFFLSDNIYAYIMESEYSVDIDSQLDFDLANLILQRKNERNH